MRHGRQRCDAFEPLDARNAEAHQRGLACIIDAMHGKDVLGEIDSNGDNAALIKPCEILSGRHDLMPKFMERLSAYAKPKTAA